MTLKGWIGTALIAALLGLATSCGGDADTTDAGGNASETFEIRTSCHPLAYLAARIAGERIEIVNAVPSGSDPATWAPDDAALGKLREADLIVLNGAEFEEGLGTVSLPESRVLKTASAFETEWLKYEKALTHSHGPQGEHSHQGTDGHTWMDPSLAKKQAATIRDALIRLRPDDEKGFRERFDALAADLDALDAEFRKISPVERKESPWWVASHPAYNYPARRYGWRVMNMDLDPETMPDAKALDELKHGSVDHAAQFLVWESAPKPEVAAFVEKETGLKSLVMSPAESVDEGDDYLKVMRRNLEVMRQVLAP